MDFLRDFHGSKANLAQDWPVTLCVHGYMRNGPLLGRFIRIGIPNVSYVKTRQTFLESSGAGAFP